MGRPLKIQKIIATANPGVDNGFNPFSSFTAAVVPEGFTPGSATEYQGVVGGSNTVDTANYPTVKCRVYITGIGAEEDGYIIRQKGAHKYLVGGTTARTALVSGVSYRITTVGDTNWNAYGLYGTAAVGTIFTATSALGDTGTGAVNAVGICVLADQADGALSEGNMNITFSVGDSTAQTVSKLTNKFLLDWYGGSDYAATSVVADKRYATNFFTDQSVVEKSGSEAPTATGGVSTVQLVIVENYNS